jgi:hypothetical protein
MAAFFTIMPGCQTKSLCVDLPTHAATWEDGPPQRLAVREAVSGNHSVQFQLGSGSKALYKTAQRTARVKSNTEFTGPFVKMVRRSRGELTFKGLPVNSEDRTRE